MDIIRAYQGTSKNVYKYIAPFAMSSSFIKKNGNPITTSDKHKWYIMFDKDGRVACFCSVKCSDSTKNMQIGNLFILSGGQKTFDLLVARIIKDIAEKGISLMAYANNANKDWFIMLGFEVAKTGVNWHNLKYKKDERLQSNNKKA